MGTLGAWSLILADAASWDPKYSLMGHPFTLLCRGTPDSTAHFSRPRPEGRLAPGLVEGGRGQGLGSWGSWAAYRAKVWCRNWYCSAVWIIPPLSSRSWHTMPRMSTSPRAFSC